MSDSMMQEILNRLDALAGKLGEGAAYTWGTYMRQAFWVDGVLTAGLAVMLAIATYFGIKLCLWNIMKVDDDDTPYNKAEKYIAGEVITGLASIITGIISIVMMYNGLTHLINPQYYALISISNMLK